MLLRQALARGNRRVPWPWVRRQDEGLELLTRRGDHQDGDRQTSAGVRKCAACFLSLASPSLRSAASPPAPVYSASVCSAGRRAAADYGDEAGPGLTYEKL